MRRSVPRTKELRRIWPSDYMGRCSLIRALDVNLKSGEFDLSYNYKSGWNSIYPVRCMNVNSCLLVTSAFDVFKGPNTDTAQISQIKYASCMSTLVLPVCQPLNWTIPGCNRTQQEVTFTQKFYSFVKKRLTVCISLILSINWGGIDSLLRMIPRSITIFKQIVSSFLILAMVDEIIGRYR